MIILWSGPISLISVFIEPRMFRFSLKLCLCTSSASITSAAANPAPHFTFQPWLIVSPTFGYQRNQLMAAETAYIAAYLEQHKDEILILVPAAVSNIPSRPRGH